MRELLYFPRHDRSITIVKRFMAHPLRPDDTRDQEEPFLAERKERFAETSWSYNTFRRWKQSPWWQQPLAHLILILTYTLILCIALIYTIWQGSRPSASVRF